VENSNIYDGNGMCCFFLHVRVCRNRWQQTGSDQNVLVYNMLMHLVHYNLQPEPSAASTAADTHQRQQKLHQQQQQ
jgi:hypothetical protein